MSFSTCFGIISKSPNTSPRMLKAAQRVPVPSRKGGAKWQQHEGMSPVRGSRQRRGAGVGRRSPHCSAVRAPEPGKRGAARPRARSINTFKHPPPSPHRFQDLNTFGALGLYGRAKVTPEMCSSERNWTQGSFPSQCPE